MKQALESIKVIDFTQLLQGPYATQMLGDLGAEVIKVEKFKSGDIMRTLTFFDAWIADQETPCFMAWNRNKKSISIDLKKPEGKEIIYKLVKDADVLVENFRPGVMNKLGFGYEELSALNPKLVYCSASGWGATGPYASRPGQDLLVQGVSGAAMTSGQAQHPPIAIGTGISDQAGAFHIVYSVLAALLHQKSTGEGQYIEVSLLQSMLAFQMQDFFTIHNLKKNFERPRSGIAHPGNPAPFGIYQTSDGYLSIAMSPWEKIVEALDCPNLAQYNDPQILFKKRDLIFDEIQNVIIRKTTDEWLKIMLGLDIWCAEVLSQKNVENDPQVQHLEAFTEIEHPVAGTIKVTNIPFKMSKTPGALRMASPLIGEHSEEILQSIGYNNEQINRLLESEVIFQHELSIH